MLRLAFDENFNDDIVRGCRRRRPGLDAFRIREVIGYEKGILLGADDPTILDWAAQEKRVLFTHDVATITKYAYERIQAGLAMPGVFEVSRSVPIRQAIEDILLLAECSLEGEWEGQVRYLPLR